MQISQRQKTTTTTARQVESAKGLITTTTNQTTAISGRLLSSERCSSFLSFTEMCPFYHLWACLFFLFLGPRTFFCLERASICKFCQMRDINNDQITRNRSLPRKLSLAASFPCEIMIPSWFVNFFLKIRLLETLSKMTDSNFVKYKTEKYFFAVDGTVEGGK